MARASDDVLGELHGMVATEIKNMILHGDGDDRDKAISFALRMLKDNNITATEANPAMGALKATVQSKLPTADELNRLMRLSPENLGSS